MQNQCDTKIEEENVQRLYLLAYLESLDVENVVGPFKSPCLHQIYNMTKLCLTIGIDESICVVCDNLVPISFLNKYFLEELPLELMRKKLQPPLNLPPTLLNHYALQPTCKIFEGMLLSTRGISSHPPLLPNFPQLSICTLSCIISL
jgi:hypothetical protein